MCVCVKIEYYAENPLEMLNIYTYGVLSGTSVGNLMSSGKYVCPSPRNCNCYRKYSKTWQFT